MNRVLLISSFSLLMMACSPASNDKQVESLPANNVQVNVDSEITPDQAKAFGENLYKKMENDESLIQDAFKTKNKDALNKLQEDFMVFTSTPFSEKETQQQLGQKYFPTDPIAEPYILCDRALNSLYIEITSMQSILREDTKYMRDSLQEKQEYYKKSKTECKTIIDMDYDSAVAEYEKYI